MKVSYNWLAEWVKLDISPQELADKLTMSGLEIEEVESISRAGVNDTILDVAVTANRGDCLGMLGMAREVGLLTNSKVQLPRISLTETGPDITELFKVKIEDAAACPRYTARLLRNVKIGPSPKWLVDKLNALGLRSINNVVDVTNYVLLEWGQPLHAFDLDLLAENRIIVRRATQNESFTTLDGLSRKLDTDMLLIADSEKAVALAGVMGGENTEVTDTTQNILLECAYFNPGSIRRTSRQLGLSTDSSYRFERGVDISALPQAIDRAAQLIQQLAGAEIARGLIDEYPNPIPAAKVQLRFERVNRVLGTKLSSSQIINIINRLEFTVLKQQAQALQLEIPGYRSDITREIDVIEEIARIYGYHNITQTTPKGCIGNNPINRLHELENRASDILIGCGFWEAINFSFTNEKVYYKINMASKGLKLKNPLNQEQQLLRTSLTPSLLENLSTNIKYQQPDVCIFELSSVYESAGLDKSRTDSVQERQLIAGAMTGKRQNSFWGEHQLEIGFYDLKGVVETLLAGFGIAGVRFSPHRISFLQPGVQVQVAGEYLGFLGQLDKDIGAELDLGQAVFLFELDFMSLVKHIPAKKVFEPLCRYPAIVRDMALVISDDVSARQVEDVIWESCQPCLREIRLFDVYRGEPLDEGYKSLGFSLTYQSNERTLTEEEVNLSCEQVVAELRQKIGATLRR